MHLKNNIKNRITNKKLSKSLGVRRMALSERRFDIYGQPAKYAPHAVSLFLFLAAGNSPQSTVQCGLGNGLAHRVMRLYFIFATAVVHFISFYVFSSNDVNSLAACVAPVVSQTSCAYTIQYTHFYSKLLCRVH